MQNSNTPTRRRRSVNATHWWVAYAIYSSVDGRVNRGMDRAFEGHAARQTKRGAPDDKGKAAEEVPGCDRRPRDLDAFVPSSRATR